ncbi:MAG TPA: glutathione synthase [Polyangiaceae bacterium]|nr:glutathione synthase [Polyangiaceae bacterium]
MRLLFVMDPAETMAPDKDTSFAFLRGARALGHTTWHCLPHHVSLRGAEGFAQTRAIAVSDTPPHCQFGEPERLALTSFDAVLIRKDPPFDAAYLYLTQQLDRVKDRVLVVNDPRGIRDANEKLFAFNFDEFTPRSLVSANPREILEFVHEVGGQAVLKPLDGAGGSGVVTLSVQDRNARSLVDIWTHEGKRLAITQEYQPAVRVGDKRVLLLEGRSLGAILRVPREDDVRANIHAGGSVVPTELTSAESAIVSAVGPKLVEHGLYFVGLDLIGEKLIEVNVTSPTGIQELSRFVGRPVEEDVIRWLEAKRDSFASSRT